MQQQLRHEKHKAESKGRQIQVARETLSLPYRMKPNHDVRYLPSCLAFLRALRVLLQVADGIVERAEGVDAYDTATDFTPFSLKG